MYGDTPIMPAFDDEALEYVLYGTGPGDPTPADVLEAWRRRDDLPEDWRKAAVAILVKDPNKGRSLSATTLSLIVGQEVQAMASDEVTSPREVLQMARLSHAAQRPKEAEAGYRKALELGVGPAALSQNERWQAMGQLAELLDRGGRTAEAKEVQALCEAAQILASSAADDLVSIRSLALKFFLDGQYATSEHLYRGLLDRRFQEPGTLVHLARVLLMRDRIAEARRVIARARKYMRSAKDLDEIPPYVHPRILFLRILCATLAGRPYGRLVTRLKQDLQADPKQEPWSIAPVIDHILPSLTTADGDLLTAIAEAINAADQIGRLDAFPVWAAA